MSTRTRTRSPQSAAVEYASELFAKRNEDRVRSLFSVLYETDVDFIDGGCDPEIDLNRLIDFEASSRQHSTLQENAWIQSLMLGFN